MNERPGPMMEIRASERGWDVVDADGKVLASFTTNAQAWRYVDRQSGEGESPKLNPVSARLRQQRRNRWRKRW